MGGQVMDAALSFRTDTEGGEAGIGLYRDVRGHQVLLHVSAADGSGRVDFVHVGGDREQSVVFLRSLAQHASLMAEAVAGWPEGHHDLDDLDGPGARQPAAAGIGCGVVTASVAGR